MKKNGIMQDIMATLLLFVIYLMFIGVGVPDSLFGVAWPVIYPEFGVSISSANMVTVTIAAGTVVSSLFSARLLSRFGISIVTAVSTTMTAIALLGCSLSPNMLFLVLFSIPLGLGAGAIDTGLNSFAASHYKATHMNYMQCFYGIGVSVSPYLMSIALEGHTWQFGYRLAFYLQAALAVISIISIPLWRKVHPETEIKTEENREKILSVSQMLKMPAVRWICLYFFAACAVELTCGTWCSTFLVEIKGLLPQDAAAYALFFYMGITIGRFVSGLLSKKWSCWTLIKYGLVLTTAALFMMMLPLPSVLSVAALFLAGFGIGPLFPNMMHLTGCSFDAEITLSISSLQMTATYIGVMIMPTVFGFLAQAFTPALYPYYLLAMTGVTVFATLGLIRELKRSGKFSI